MFVGLWRGDYRRIKLEFLDCLLFEVGWFLGCFYLESDFFVSLDVGDSVGLLEGVDCWY